MTTREYDVTPHNDGFRIIIKKKKTSTSKVEYDYLLGYLTEAAANLDVLRYQRHVADNKRHISFTRLVSVPDQTPSKRIKIANELMRRTKQGLVDQKFFGTAHNLKMRGLKNQYSLYVAKRSGFDKPPLPFVEWEDLYVRKTPDQRARHFRQTARGALIRDNASLGDLSSPDTDTRVKGLHNSMRYMTQSIEHVKRLNLKLNDQFNKLVSSIRLLIV